MAPELPQSHSNAAGLRRLGVLAFAVLLGTASATLGSGFLDGGTGIDPYPIGESAKDTIQNVAKAGGGALAVSVAVRVGVKWVKRLVGFA